MTRQAPPLLNHREITGGKTPTRPTHTWEQIVVGWPTVGSRMRLFPRRTAFRQPRESGAIGERLVGSDGRDGK